MTEVHWLAGGGLQEQVIATRSQDSPYSEAMENTDTPLPPTKSEEKQQKALERVEEKLGCPLDHIFQKWTPVTITSLPYATLTVIENIIRYYHRTCPNYSKEEIRARLDQGLNDPQIPQSERLPLGGVRPTKHNLDILLARLEVSCPAPLSTSDDHARFLASIASGFRAERPYTKPKTKVSNNRATDQRAQSLEPPESVLGSSGPKANRGRKRRMIAGNTSPIVDEQYSPKFEYEDYPLNPIEDNYKLEPTPVPSIGMEHATEVASRQGTPVNDSGEVLSANILEDALITLKPKAELSSTVIAKALSCVSPEDCFIFDPLFFNEDSVERYQPRHKPGTFSKFLLPIYSANHNHWSLAVITVQDSSITVYDSLIPTRDNSTFSVEPLLTTLAKKLVFEQDEWEFSVEACPVQDNSYDCGIYVIATAFFIMAQATPPDAYDGDLWRLICQCLLGGPKNYNLFATPFVVEPAAGKLSSLDLIDSTSEVINTLCQQADDDGGSLLYRHRKHKTTLAKHLKVVEQYRSFVSKYDAESHDSLPELYMTLFRMESTHQILQERVERSRARHKAQQDNKKQIKEVLEALATVKITHESLIKQGKRKTGKPKGES